MYSSRDQIPEKHKWKLNHIYESRESIDKDFNFVKTNIKEIVKYKGKLNKKNTIIEFLNFQQELSKKIHSLYVFARMQRDTNMVDKHYQDLSEKISNLAVNAQTALSFSTPEISACSNELLGELSKDTNHKEYSYFFEEIIKNKKHILTEKEENILSRNSSFIKHFQDAFNMLSDSELKFKKVNLNGEKVQLTHGNYILFLQSKDQKERRDAYRAMLKPYKEHIETISNLYIGNMKATCMIAEVRKYKSALNMALSASDVSSVVYENLIKSVRDNVSVLHEYMSFRKEKLGLDKLYMSDLTVGMYDCSDIALEYDDAYSLVVDALKPLGKEYQDLLNGAMEDGWIDVFETPNKRSGAYSWGCYTSHPYVLLNYYKTTRDIFTIAHEMGHALHTYKSNNAQPYPKAGYTIFVAEVASTVNEVLLLKHLIKVTKDVKLSNYLRSYYLDMIRSTFFRQAQFAEFEQIAHNEIEKKGYATSDILNMKYYNLNKKYYGKSVSYDKLISYEWARIPHFYSDFYVYQYATGIASAVMIANAIYNNKPGAKENYMKFLSLGGSMSPVEILKVAGVDLTNKNSYDAIISEFKTTLAELRGN